VTSHVTAPPVPRPPQIAELLQDWKAHARKHERRAREHRQAAELAEASRTAWRDKADTALRRHALAQVELMRVRAELVEALALLDAAGDGDAPSGTALPSCPGCRGRWAGAWSWNHKPWCPVAAAEAAEAQADRLARPPLLAVPVLTRPPTVTEAALWARVTGKGWPVYQRRPARVEVRFISHHHRLRTLAQYSNARDARAAARATSEKGTP
jgi:hypothetical protein